MELIYSSPNGSQIQQLQDILNEQGIPSRIIRKSSTKNEYKAIGYSFTELWLTNEFQYQCAKSIISRFETKDIKDTLKPTHLSWECEEENMTWSVPPPRSPPVSGEQSVGVRHDAASLDDGSIDDRSKRNENNDRLSSTPTMDDLLAVALIEKWFHLKRFTADKRLSFCSCRLDDVSLYQTQRYADQGPQLVLEGSVPYWIHQSRKSANRSRSTGLTPKQHSLRHYHHP